MCNKPPPPSSLLCIEATMLPLLRWQTLRLLTFRRACDQIEWARRTGAISRSTTLAWLPLQSLAVKKKLFSRVNKSARGRIGRQNLSQKVPSKKGSLGVMFSPRNYRENPHSKSAKFEGRHSGGHLLGRPLLFTSDFFVQMLGGEKLLKLVEKCR